MSMIMLHLAEKKGFLDDHIHLKVAAAKEVLTRRAVNRVSDENSYKTAFVSSLTGINA